MNLKTVFKTCLLFLVLLAATNVESSQWPQKLNYLKDVVTELEDSAIVFRIEFQKPGIHFKGPTFYKKSVQMDFTDAFVKPAKRYFSTQDPLISQVYVSQFNADTVRVRFVHGEDDQNLADHFHWEKQGRFLIVRIDKKDTDILEELLKKIRKQTEGVVGEPAESPRPVPAAADTSFLSRTVKTEKPELLPEPKNIGQNEKTKPLQFLDYKNPSDYTQTDLMSSGMKMFSMLAVVLAVMFFIFYLFKKFVLKNGLLGAGGKWVKVLATGMLAPKKSIALVEVAGEILVLGISQNHIALLSTIRDEEKIQKMKSENGNSGKLWSAFKSKDESRGNDHEKADKSPDPFSKYLKRFSDGKSSKDQSIAGVNAMIQQNLGRMRMAQ